MIQHCAVLQYSKIDISSFCDEIPVEAETNLYFSPIFGAD